MQEMVVVQPLSAIAATKSPKPFSSAAVHSVLMMRQSGGAAAAPDDPIAKTPAVDRTNAIANEARIEAPLVKATPRLERNLSKRKSVRHRDAEKSRSNLNEKREEIASEWTVCPMEGVSS